jgi:thiamine-monophosphate kinase
MASSKQVAEGSAEDRLIARYFKPIAQHRGAFGLDDDAAALTIPAGCDLVLTADAVVAGVHFLADDPPDTVAKKSLRVNLSDLAAKGARPVGFLLTLALPKETGDTWLAPFARGLAKDAQLFACPLLGGDTVRTPGPIAVSISAFGVVARDRMVRRAGAVPGERVVVTGTVGDAALGLILRRSPAMAEHWGLGPLQKDHLEARYLVPQPRSTIAESIAAHASAAIDVSDGLAGDLAKLARASGADVEIEVARVPLSDAARAALAKEPALIEAILTGGDDYEVAATVPVGSLEPLRQQASAAGVAITEIGKVVAGQGKARLIGSDGEPLVFAHPSFSHF